MTAKQPRPSKRPLFDICASSAIVDDVVIEVARDEYPLTLGTATHEAAERLVAAIIAGEERPGVADISAKYGVNLSDLDRRVDSCWRLLWELLPWLDGNVRTEAMVDTLGGGGTADLVVTYDGLDEENVAALVVDWKGRSGHMDHQAQVDDYALGVVDSWVERRPPHNRLNIVHPSAITVCAYLDDDRWTVKRRTYRGLCEWGDAQVDRLEKAGKEYVAGSHCSMCPRYVVCEQRQLAATSALSVISGDITELSVKQAAAAYAKIPLVERAIKDLKASLFAAVDAHGSAVPTGDGQEAYIVEKRKSDIDPRKAWAALKAEGYTDDDLAGVIKMGKGKIEAIAAGRVEKGKGVARKQIIQALEEAGAIAYKTGRELAKRKARK